MQRERCRLINDRVRRAGGGVYQGREYVYIINDRTKSITRDDDDDDEDNDDERRRGITTEQIKCMGGMQMRICQSNEFRNEG